MEKTLNASPGKAATTPIDVVDDIDRQQFETQYLRPERPLVIRNLTRDWAAREKWTLQFLADVIGERPVPLYDTNKLQANAPVNTPTVEMPFNEYLGLLERGTNLRIFLLNLLKISPELTNDFSVPHVVDRVFDRFPTLFLGPAGSRVFLHYDIDLSHVFHTQFGGRKRVILFPPAESRRVYGVPLAVRSMMDNDPEALNLNKYPAMALARGYETTLNHGDTLFMPSGYWHHMHYLETGFALSQRTLHKSWSVRGRAAYKIFVERSVDNVLRRLLGERWVSAKERWAMQRGLKEIEKAESTGD